MPSEVSSMPVIDADSHWTEPPDLWSSRAPAQLRDQALRVERSDKGIDRWVFDDGEIMGPVGYCSIRPDGSKGRAQVAFDTFDECHPGAIEVAPRLQYMDEHGLTMQIVYPNVLGFAGGGIMRVKDEAHRKFCATAYNDACSEFQAESGGRLFPQAMLPFWDVSQSVQELERCQDDLGLTGFVITDATNEWGLPPLQDSHWDPLWDAAQSRGMPVNFHIGGGGAPVRLWGNSFTPARAFAALSTMSQMGNMICMTNLLLSGLLDKFPRLKFVSVESGVGWLPFLLESLDYQYDENGVSDLKLRPSEYFRRQVYGSYWFESDISNAVNQLGADNLMFETDFPHATCLYPGVKETTRASVEQFDTATQRKLLYENAARVYQLPSPV